MAKTRSNAKKKEQREAPIPVPENAASQIEKLLAVAQNARNDFQNYVQAVADVVGVAPGWKLDTDRTPMAFVPPVVGDERT